MCVGAERAHGGRVQRHPHRGKGFEPLEDKARRMLKVRYGMQGTDRHLPCAEQEPAWARTEIHVSVWWHVAPTLASCKSPKRPLEMVFPQACKLRITDLEQSSRLAKVHPPASIPNPCECRERGRCPILTLCNTVSFASMLWFRAARETAARAFLALCRHRILAHAVGKSNQTRVNVACIPDAANFQSICVILILIEPSCLETLTKGLRAARRRLIS